MNTLSKRLNRLPPYMFGKLKQLTHERRQQGIDVIDLGMGNPDRPTPQHIVDKLTEAAQEGRHHRYSASRGFSICAVRSVGTMNDALVSRLTLTMKRSQ